MKLVDMTLTEFGDLLASDSAAPGGGSTAALEGALGAALVGMVATFTIGRKKYAEHDALMNEIVDKAEKIRAQLMDIIDRDTEAFNKVSAVFAMPKETDAERAARADAMQEALKGCTRTPFEMMECALAALELAESMIGKFNTSAASDLGMGALSLKSAVQGAWLNILINIGGIKDEVFAGQYRQNGQAILDKALPLSDKVCVAVMESM